MGSTNIAHTRWHWPGTILLGQARYHFANILPLQALANWYQAHTFVPILAQYHVANVLPLEARTRPVHFCLCWPSTV